MKIEKNIPMPINKTSLIRSLKIGDSLVFPGDSYLATSLARQLFGESGHISCRKIDSETTRIWRIK